MEKVSGHLIIQTLWQKEDELFKKANVVGLGVGEKIKHGLPQGRLCAKVYVEKKIPKASLSKKDLIPQELSLIETDVEEVGRLMALAIWKAKPLPYRLTAFGNTWRYRPALGGVSIGHYKITAGTFSCLVRDKKTGKILILSNNHVLANSNTAQRGDPILQPGSYDRGRRPKDIIGFLENWIEIKFGKETNLIDSALARPKKANLVKPEIMMIGLPKGITKARLGMPVQKSGRTTGYTTGKIKDVNATLKINYANKIALFRNQILTTNMSEGGDSGSLVMDMRKRVVGLLFAGSELVTILNPINEVFKLLNIELFAG